MTKRDLNAPVTIKMLNEAVDAILHGVERMFYKQDKRIDLRFMKVDQRFKNVDERLGKVETDVRDIRRRMIVHEVDTPTRKEFSELKGRVDKHHPLVG
jgi:hypothetical protein